MDIPNGYPLSLTVTTGDFSIIRLRRKWRFVPSVGLPVMKKSLLALSHIHCLLQARLIMLSIGIMFEKMQCTSYLVGHHASV